MLGLFVILVGMYAVRHYEERKQSVLAKPILLDLRCFGMREEDTQRYQLVQLKVYEEGIEGELSFYNRQQQDVVGKYQGQYIEEDTIRGVYTVTTSGQEVHEERVIKMNEFGILFGYGPMEYDEDGVLRYKDMKTIEYDYQLPLILCNRYENWKQEATHEG